jgi:acetyl-CoA acetyltransferase
MMMSNFPSIVGVGSTPYYRRGRSVPRTSLELATEAILGAADDAGLKAGDIDGFAMYSGGLQVPVLAQMLGIPDLGFTAALTGGGGGSAGAIGLAAAAIESGLAHVVVVVMVVQQAAYRLGRGDSTTGPYAFRPTAETDFSVPFGWVSPAQKYAMSTQRHMHLYGTTREHFAEVAISSRENARRRPGALMQKPLDLDAYFSAPMLSDPLCLYDYCLESDGAVAVVITSADRARDLRQRPVRIRGTAMGGDGRFGPQVAWANAPDDYLASAFSRAVAKRLYNAAGMGPQEVNVALLYDHFSPMVLFQLEDYGFCPPGASGEFVAGGNIRWPGGSLPVNTHGGHLSEAYVMGMTHVREAVEQLRGTAVNQVDGAEVALVTGGPAMIPVSAAILTV